VAAPPKDIKEPEEKIRKVSEFRQRFLSMQLAQDTEPDGVELEVEISCEQANNTDKLKQVQVCGSPVDLNAKETVNVEGTNVDPQQATESQHLTIDLKDGNSLKAFVSSSKTALLNAVASTYAFARCDDVDKPHALAKAYAVTKHETEPKSDALMRNDSQVAFDKHFASTVYTLPWWFIYVTWTVLAFYNLFLAYYVILYGLSLGYERSVDWALAFFTGFFSSVFFIEPANVIFMVFILVLVFHQAHTIKDHAPVKRLYEGIKLVQEKSKFNREFRSLLPEVRCRPPLRTAEAALVIERHAIEKAAREILRDLLFYTLFMLSVILVAYGHIDVQSQFLQTQYVKHKFLKTPFLKTDLSK
ncbi:unnamed protein product, partial [Candidula unifasciata]